MITTDLGQIGAPLIFQRSPGDVNAPSASLSIVPSYDGPAPYPQGSEFIAATKMSGTAYDDLVVKGLQVYGDQTTVANNGPAGYITGDINGIIINTPGLYTSSLFVSTLTAGSVIVPGTATSFTASVFMSTPILYSDNIENRIGITTSNITMNGTLNGFNAGFNGTTTLNQASIFNAQVVTASISTANISSVVANNGTYSTLNSLSASFSSLSASTLSASTIVASNINISSISTGVITAQLGNFSSISTGYLTAGNVSTFGNLIGLDTGTLNYGTISADVSVGSRAFNIRNNVFPPSFVGSLTGNTLGVQLQADSGTVFLGNFLGGFYPAQILPNKTVLLGSTITGPGAIITNLSSQTISTLNLNTQNFSTLNSRAGTLFANTATFSTANISTIAVGNFTANQIDANTLSSLTSRVSFAITSTLQLKADVTVSPDINLGLGNVIQGLIGGAATQALGVTIGAAGLATGATALITGRTSGGVNPSIFQTVNGSTQLQFSTLGSAATSVFLDTDSAAPLTTPGNLTRTTTIVPAGTYCVRSVSDPLNIDSATRGIQMFGQWVPVVTGQATFPTINVSTLNASTLTSRSASISSLFVSSLVAGASVAPDILTASSINMSGNLNGFNPAATLAWAGPSILLSTSIHRLSLVDQFLGAQGQIFGINQPNTGITVVAPNGMRIQNADTPLIPNIGFNSNATVDIYSTLRVAGVQAYGVANVSTLNVSTLNANIQAVIPPVLGVSTLNVSGNVNLSTNSLLFVPGSGIISSLTVSSLFTPGSSNAGIPSTLNASTVNVSGSLTLNNPGFGIFVNTPNNRLPGIQYTNLASQVQGSLDGFSSAQPITPGLFMTVNSNFSISGGFGVNDLIARFTFADKAMAISTVNASTVNTTTINTSNISTTSLLVNGIATISTLNVSTLNANILATIPSTLNASTINMTGPLTLNNAGFGIFISSPNNQLPGIQFANLSNQVQGSLDGFSLTDGQISTGLFMTVNSNFTINGGFGLNDLIARFSASNKSLNISTVNTTNLSTTFLRASTITAPVFNIQNTAVPLTNGILTGGNPSLGLNGVYLATNYEFDVAINPNKVGSIFNVNTTGGGRVTANTGFFANGVTTSTLSARTGTISSFTVSSINGAIYPPSGLAIPSTLAVSSLTATGNVTLTNAGALFQAATTGVQNRSVQNTNGVSQGVITGGNPDLGQSGVYITAQNGLKLNTLSQAIFNATITDGFATLNMGAAGSANSIIYSQIFNATSNVRIFPTGSPTVPVALTAPNNTDALLLTNGALSISTNGASSGAPGFAPLNVNAQTINMLGQQGFNLTSTAPVNVVPGISTPTINVSSINGAVYPPPAVLLPAGAVITWGGLTAPTGWLICDGSTVLVATYPALYAAIGVRYTTNFQSAPPVGSFYLPDLTYAVPMGARQTNYQATISFRTGPDINSYCPPGSNKLWEIQTVVRGQINIGSRFNLVGATGDIFIAKFIDWNPANNGGYVLVFNNNPTIPSVGPGFFPLTGTGAAGALYTSGKYGGAGVPNTAKTMTLEEIAPHTHGGSPGTYTTGTGASPPQAGTNGPTVYQDGVNSINGVGFVNTAYRMDPNYISMFYIIKT